MTFGFSTPRRVHDRRRLLSGSEALLWPTMARTIIRAAAPISVNATSACREFDLTDSGFTARAGGHIPRVQKIFIHLLKHLVKYLGQERGVSPSGAAAPT